MPRVTLRVPYKERTEAKRLGALWDARARTWFVPDGTSPALFAAWLPPDMTGARPAGARYINIRAPGYYIAKSDRCCWHCHLFTPVYGFALEPPFEALLSGLAGAGFDETPPAWRPAEASAWLLYVRNVDDAMISRLAELASSFFSLDTSSGVSEPYLMNHCEHCGSRLGDEETVGKFNAPLSPVFLTDIAKVTLYSVAEPFSAKADAKYTLGVDAISLAHKVEFSLSAADEHLNWPASHGHEL